MTPVTLYLGGGRFEGRLKWVNLFIPVLMSHKIFHKGLTQQKTIGNYTRQSCMGQS